MGLVILVYRQMRPELSFMVVPLHSAAPSTWKDVPSFVNIEQSTTEED